MGAGGAELLSAQELGGRGVPPSMLLWDGSTRMVTCSPSPSVSLLSLSGQLLPPAPAPPVASRLKPGGGDGDNSS